jgi:iron complex transport system ATP-binding protein
MRAGRSAAAEGEREIPAAALRVRGLGVELEGTTILDGVDLDVRPGEVVALLGPNGAGKSTLLGCVAGDVAAARGTVELDERLLGSFSSGERARRRGVMTQEAHVAFPFTVAEVVALGRAPWSRSPEADRDDAVVDEALAATDTTELRDRRFPSLSGGERARASFARLLAQRTPVLLLDEPTAALDLGHQEQLLGTLRDLASAGASVVVVLHDLSLAAAWADRLVLLERGRVVAAGTPAEVLTAERVSQVYGHSVTIVPDPSTGAPLVVPVRVRGGSPRELHPRIGLTPSVPGT